MRVEPRIAYGISALHEVGQARNDDEEIVDLAIARLAARAANHAAYLLDPPGGYQLSWGAVLIASNDPTPFQPGQGEGYGFKEVEVVLGRYSSLVDHAGAIHAAKTTPSSPQGPHMLRPEMAWLV